MNDINKLLRAASIRLMLIDLFGTLCITIAAAAVVVMGVAIADKFMAGTFAYPLIAWIAGGSAAVGALLWTIIRRARGVELARQVDERADLRESLSTAMCVRNQPDPWAAAVVQTAVERARAVKLRESIPFVAPRLLPMPVVALLVMTLAFFLPTFGGATPQSNTTEEILTKVSSEADTLAKELKEKLKKTNPEFKLDEEEPDNGGDGRDLSPEDRLRDEVRKLTNFAQKVEDLKNQDNKAEKLEAMKSLMQQVRQPGPGPMKELTQALQKADFAKAKEELSKLSEKMSSGQMSDDEKSQLKQQMDNLGKQMEKLADNQKALDKKLQEAGLSKEQAEKALQDPQAMKEAMEKLENLSEQQKKELMDTIQSQLGACKACENMAQSMSKMAQSMQAGQKGMSQQGMDAMGGMSGQLSEMEMMQGDLDDLNAKSQQIQAMLGSLGQCNNPGGECQGAFANMGQWKAGDSSKSGSGSGGPGKGNMAPGPESQQSPFTLEKTKANTKFGDGPVIGTKLVQGELIRGEARQQFSEVVQFSQQNATESIEKMEIPLEFQEAVRAFYGRLDERAKDKEGESK